MRLKFLIVLFTINYTLISAQEKQKDSLSNWKTEGKATLLFNQSSFSNWISGGDNAVAGNLNVDYIVNYKNKNWTWNNSMRLAYGINDSKSKGTRKTEDRVEWKTLVGYKKDKNWYYSFFLNFQTQFLMDMIIKRSRRYNTHFNRFFTSLYKFWARYFI